MCSVCALRDGEGLLCCNRTTDARCVPHCSHWCLHCSGLCRQGVRAEDIPRAPVAVPRSSVAPPPPPPPPPIPSSSSPSSARLTSIRSVPVVPARETAAPATAPVGCPVGTLGLPRPQSPMTVAASRVESVRSILRRLTPYVEHHPPSLNSSTWHLVERMLQFVELQLTRRAV